MKIDRNNYEVFIIDYFDGKLDTEAISVLMLFLDENPDLKEEFELFKQPLPQPESVIFKKKEALKKKTVKEVAGINEGNYEEYFIGFFEGELKQEEREDLEIFLGLNESLREEFQLYGNVILKPDLSVQFELKSELKKKSELKIVYYFVSVAAIALLFFTIYPFLNTEIPVKQINERTQLSKMEKINSVHTVSQTVEAIIIIPSKIIDPIQLFEEKPLIQETENLTVLESRIIQLDVMNSLPQVLADQTKFIALNEAFDKNIQEKEKRSALGRVIHKNVGNLLARFKNENKQGNNQDEPVFVKVLDQSLMVFNTITGSDKELLKVYTKDGQLSSYGFEGNAITLNRSLNKPAN